MPFVRGPNVQWGLGNSMMCSWRQRFNSHVPQPPPKRCSVCSSKVQEELHSCPAFVICCIDFRLRDNETCHLNQLGLRDKYDETCTAGASLGYNGFLDYNTTGTWTTYIDNQIQVSCDLHDISQIVLVEHAQCGAYAAQYGDIYGLTGNYLEPDVELKLQIENLNKAGHALWAKFNGDTSTIQKIPNLTIVGYQMSIDACTFTEIYNHAQTPG